MRLLPVMGLLTALGSGNPGARAAPPQQPEPESPPFSSEEYIKTHTPEERDLLVDTLVGGGGGRYALTPEGALVDRQGEEPRPLTVRDAERIRDLYLLEKRLRAPPADRKGLRMTRAMLLKTAGDMEADPELFFAGKGTDGRTPADAARDAAAGLRQLAKARRPVAFRVPEARTMLRLLDPGWGDRDGGPPPHGAQPGDRGLSDRAPEAPRLSEEEIAARAAATPRAINRHSAAIREVEGPRPESLRRAESLLQGVETQVQTGLAAAGLPRMGWGWAGNALPGITGWQCGQIHDTLKPALERVVQPKLAKDGLEMVTLFRDGSMGTAEGIFNHQYFGIRRKGHNTAETDFGLVGVWDPWAWRSAGELATVDRFDPGVAMDKGVNALSKDFRLFMTTWPSDGSAPQTVEIPRPK